MFTGFDGFVAVNLEPLRPEQVVAVNGFAVSNDDPTCFVVANRDLGGYRMAFAC